MRYRVVLPLGVILMAPCALAQGVAFEGKHCEVKLSFDNRPFAANVAVFVDRAIEALREIQPGAAKRGPYVVEFFQDPSAHAAAVRRARAEPSGSASSESPLANTYANDNRALIFLKSAVPSAEISQRCGLTGEIAWLVIESACPRPRGFGGSTWLRTGLETWLRARAIGVRDEAARRRDPLLSPPQVLVQRLLETSGLPTVQALVDYGISQEEARTACMQELFFMLMDRHGAVFRQFVAASLTQNLLDDPLTLQDLVKLLPAGTDLDEEFREHCANLAPEWDRSDSWEFSRTYFGPRNRLTLHDASGWMTMLTRALPTQSQESTSGWTTMLTQAQPTRSQEFTITGRLEFVTDARDALMILSFLGEGGTLELGGAQSVAFVWFERDGRVIIGPNSGGSDRDEALAKRFATGAAVPFKVSADNGKLMVEVGGRKVCERQLTVDLTHKWAVACSQGATVILHDLKCSNPSQLAACVEDLADPVRKAAARAVLLDHPEATSAVLAARLQDSPSLGGAGLDPALEIAPQLPSHAGELLPAVRSYLGRCDKRQVLKVLDILEAVAARAPRPARQALIDDPLLQGPSPHAVDQAAWRVRCLALRRRLEVDPDAPVADLIAVVEADRLFVREAAATALGARGEAATDAVPALLAGLESRGATGAGDADIVVDGKKVQLRDRFAEAARQALVAIAPGDVRLHEVYTHRLAHAPQPSTRVAAAKALGAMGIRLPRNAVFATVRALKATKDETVLLAVIEAVAEMGSTARGALYYLRRFASDKSSSDAVKSAATAAIGNLTK